MRRLVALSLGTVALLLFTSTVFAQNPNPSPPSPSSPSGPETFLCVGVVGVAPAGGWDSTSLQQAIASGAATISQVDSPDNCPFLAIPSFAIPSFEIPSFAIPSFEIPSFAIPSFAIPSFNSDTDLAAKFPTTIDGQPVTNLTTALYIDLLNFSGQQEQIQTISQTLSSIGIDINTMSFGTASATIDGEDVMINALRVPGGQAQSVIDNFQVIAQAFGSTDTSAVTISQASLGGKNISVGVDAEGNKTYLYPSGDTLWVLDSMTESQATKVLSALQ